MDFVLWSWIALAIPLFVFFYYYMYDKWYTNKPEWTDGSWSEGQKLEYAAGTWANRFGYVAMVALSFFMIPASRHGPVLSLFGWHPYHACTIHMFAGWLSFWTSWLHFICYIIKYSTSYYPRSSNAICEEEQGGWPGWRWIFPPAICFTYNNQKSYEWLNPETDEIEMIDPPCYRDCGKMINGFYGTVAILAFTILAVTSMQVVRRYKYSVFYFAHVICAPLFIIFVVMHWKFIYYYFVPSAVYYFATQVPFLVQHSRTTVENYGLKIVNVMDIPCRQSPKKKEGEPEQELAPKKSLLARIFSPDSIDWLDEQLNRKGPQAKSIEHCVSFDFMVSEVGFEQFYPGMYGNIWFVLYIMNYYYYLFIIILLFIIIIIFATAASHFKLIPYFVYTHIVYNRCPDASMKSHPFSVTHVPGRTDQLRIIFRVFGKWVS